MLGYFVRRAAGHDPDADRRSASLVFVIIQAPPGDYLTTYIDELQSQGEAVDPDKIAVPAERYGLDKPFLEQYRGQWVFSLVQGDLGYSFEYNLPVQDVVGDRLC